MDGPIYDNACTVEKRSSGAFKSGLDLALVIGQKMCQNTILNFAT